MADSLHIENRRLAIYPRVIDRLTRYLVCTSRTMLRHTHTADFGFKDGQVTKYQNFANSKWRTAAIFKIFLAISQRFIVRLMRNLI